MKRLIILLMVLLVGCEGEPDRCFPEGNDCAYKVDYNTSESSNIEAKLDVTVTVVEQIIEGEIDD